MGAKLLSAVVWCYVGWCVLAAVCFFGVELHAFWHDRRWRP
jgi:hypothetical protein